MVSRLGPKYQDVVDIQYQDDLNVLHIVDTSALGARDEPLGQQVLVDSAEAGNRRRPETIQPCFEPPDLLLPCLRALKPF